MIKMKRIYKVLTKCLKHLICFSFFIRNNSYQIIINKLYLKTKFLYKNQSFSISLHNIKNYINFFLMHVESKD